MARKKVSFWKKLPGGKRKRVTFMRDTSKPRKRKRLGNTPDFASNDTIYGGPWSPSDAPASSFAGGTIYGGPWVSPSMPPMPPTPPIFQGVGDPPEEHQRRATNLFRETIEVSKLGLASKTCKQKFDFALVASGAFRAGVTHYASGAGPDESTQELRDAHNAKEALRLAVRKSCVVGHGPRRR